MMHPSYLCTMSQVNLIIWSPNEQKNGPTLGHNKKSFLKNPVTHIDITDFDSRKIIESMGKMSFTSRDTANASKIFNEMIEDKDCTIF